MLRAVQTGVLIISAVIAMAGKAVAATNEVLTTAADVRSLPVDRANQKISVCITGIVTVAEANWGGKFFLQDATGGIFVNNAGQQPVPGDVVQVSGFSHDGGYSPDIISPTWKWLGTAPLPEPKQVSVEKLVSGAEDGQRVEVSAGVTSAKMAGEHLALELSSGDYHFRAYPPISTDVDLGALVGEAVRVRGTAAVALKGRQKSSLSVILFVPQESDFICDRLPAAPLTNGVLTNAADVLALTANQAAKKIHVSITGIVTIAEPNWRGKFFVQDSTAGVFVNSSASPQPIPGELIHVDGETDPGGYAPDIVSPRWRRLGTAPLPEAKKVSVERLMTGAEDGNRVEIQCTFRSSEVWSDGRVGLDLVSGRYAFQAFAPIFTNLDVKSLAGATVRVRGTAATSFNILLRQIVTVVLFVPQESDFIVEKLPDAAELKKPFISLNAIAQYRRNDPPGARVRVRGTVTYQRVYDDIFLHDQTGGLEIESNDTNVFEPGQIIEAFGFPGLKNFLPVLEDAVFINELGSRAPAIPTTASITNMLRGLHHADLVSVQGTLLYHSLHQVRSVDASLDTPNENILTLQSGGFIFNVEAPGTPEFAGLLSIPIGSTLDVTGICLQQTDDGGKIIGVQILLREARDIQILRQPSWWTPGHLFIGIGILLGISSVGATWTLMIIRKNSALKVSISEKVKAQDELQKTNDLLETKVEERTLQLKSEMDARKEAEVRFQATVTERRRIAQELHDTLLQGFTGIGLKLEALMSNLPSSLGGTKEQLNNLLKQSDEYLIEARRAVWELRSLSLEKVGEFSNALAKVSERALQGTNICFALSTSGTPIKPDAVVEDNLLRICEEAVTNAVKHARPTHVEVNLDYQPEALRLQIRDDGCGFDPQGTDSSKHGHFGLVGICERANAIEANLTIKSKPGQGTEILVAVPASG